MAPGFFRETVSVAMTSATVETFVIADPGNGQGFKTSGGARVAPAPVVLTAYTTNNTTASSATVLLALAGRDHLTFQGIIFVGGNNARVVNGTTTTSTDIKFQDCEFHPFQDAITIDMTTVFGTALNFTMDRCVIGPAFGSPVIQINAPTGTGSDYDLNVQIQNTLILAAGSTRTIRMTTSGASANKPGGIDMHNVTLLQGQEFFSISSANGSTSIPCTVNNCYMRCSVTALTAGAAGAITEDYNIIEASTARSNVTAGAHSISDGSRSTIYSYGQERIWGAIARSVGEPFQTSGLLGFGNDGAQTAYELRNTIRPAGGTSGSPAAGAMERGNSWIIDPSPIGTSVSPIKITGPGYEAFAVPLPVSTATTIAVTVKWDATYAGTKPQLQLIATPSLGIAGQTVTAVGGSGSNETLTLSAITATQSYGFVTVLVVSNDTNGGGLVQSDNFTVSV